MYPTNHKVYGEAQAILAGDALRSAERFEEAISEYRSVLGLSATGPNQSQIDRMF